MNSAHRGIGMTSQRTRLRLISRLQERGIKDLRVLEAMSELPRHIFVDEALATRAYEDTALPIGYGQTISQPYVVARMSETLLVGREHCERVLEVGTGCGYQCAVLAKLCREVYSVERVGPLLSKARKHMGELRLNNVRLKLGDGYQGWAEHAPYDGILVAAAPPEIPESLLQQLAEGGRLVLPVGEEGGAQQLYVVTRNGNDYEQETLEMVSFVPMLPGLRK